MPKDVSGNSGSRGPRDEDRIVQPNGLTIRRLRHHLGWSTRDLVEAIAEANLVATGLPLIRSLGKAKPSFLLDPGRTGGCRSSIPKAPVLGHGLT